MNIVNFFMIVSVIMAIDLYIMLSSTFGRVLANF